MIIYVGWQHFSLRFIGLGLAVLIVSSCGIPLPGDVRQSLGEVHENIIDFQEIEFFIERAASAYDDHDKIQADYPNLVHVTTLAANDLQYFIQADVVSASQTIAIRGTAGRANLLEDLEIALVPDEILGLRIHRGFRDDATAIFKDAVRFLDKDTPVRVTGHSLGGAIAAILAAYLDEAGYRVERVMTFGQPRFSTQSVSKKVVAVTTRVVNGTDVVPMVPPYSLFTPYRHHGAEVILLPEKEFVYLDQHEADRVALGEFWRELDKLSLDLHSIDAYVGNIQFKVGAGAQQIAYLSSSS